jgi:2-oxoglutarate dehydrogenase E2 component (dihydrolipoamide succinyltransferase)
MIVDVTLPQLGESVSEGTISKWFVREGDVVTKDQPLVSIATDKADSDLPAPVGGRITKLLVAEGDVVPVKTVIARIEEGAAGAVGFAPQQPAPSFATAGPLSAAPGAPISVSPIPSLAASAASGPGIPAAPSTGARASGALATPNVRKTALENDVDIDRVQGTGERGRVTRDDVMRAASPAPAIPAAPAPARMPSNPPPAIEPPQTKATAQTKQIAQMMNQGSFVPPIPGVGYGAFKVPAYRPIEGDKVVPFTRRRRITADHMTYSKFASPHVVTVAEVDLHKTGKVRDSHKDRYKAEGLSLTMLAFVVVATARALRETPSMNTRVLEDAFVVFRDVNVGVAVDSPEGLVVPVVRRADELGVRGVVRSIDDLAKRARSGKITVDDLSGATFSVTNPGPKGNLFGGAIINQPNVGILRMGEVQKRPVVIESPDGEDLIAVHPVMYMALSYDHRVVDGVAANGFLWRVTEILEKAEFEV